MKDELGWKVDGMKKKIQFFFSHPLIYSFTHATTEGEIFPLLRTHGESFLPAILEWLCCVFCVFYLPSPARPSSF
jgi:hypothetical protein